MTIPRLLFSLGIVILTSQLSFRPLNCHSERSEESPSPLTPREPHYSHPGRLTGNHRILGSINDRVPGRGQTWTSPRPGNQHLIAGGSPGFSFVDRTDDTG